MVWDQIFITVHVSEYEKKNWLDWVSRLHSVHSCYRLLCSSVKEQPDTSWSSSWVSDSCRTTWQCTKRSKTTVTPGRPVRQTLRLRVHLATPTSGFKPTPFGKFLSLKNGCLKVHNFNLYMDLGAIVWFRLVEVWVWSFWMNWVWQ